MTKLLKRMARWAIDSELADFDFEVRRRARLLLLDTLGCALAARGHVLVRKAAEVADSLMGTGNITGLGTGVKRAPMGAALDSGAAIRALDFNDFYWGPGLGGHPSDMFATAFTVSEERDSTLDDVLRAVIIGYEFYLRLLDLMEDGPYDHTTAGAIGAAAIVAVLMGLDEEQFAHALSIAATRGPALAAVRYGHISEAKGLAAAIACLNGLLAGRLAAAGVTGPVEEITGARGIPAFVRIGADPNSLIPKAGDEPKIRQVVVKRFPAMGTSQASASVALTLHGRLSGQINRIQALDFRLSDSPLTRHQTTGPYRRPQNRETADHSFPAVIAMTLAEGGLNPRHYERRRYEDADVLALIDRMSFIYDLGGVEDGSYPAEAAATLDGGTRMIVKIDYAPGHPRNPMDEATARQKFADCVAGVLSSTGAERVSMLCLDGGNVRIRDVLAALR